MKVFIFIQFVMISFISCKSNVNTNSQEKETDITKECFTAKDTFFENGSVKYVSIGNKYGVEITINNHVDTLNILFDCKVVNGLIPTLLESTENKLILKRGAA